MIIDLSMLETPQVQDKGDLLSNLTMQLENQAAHRCAELHNVDQILYSTTCEVLNSV